MTEFLSFIILRSILTCICTTFLLPVHPFMEIFLLVIAMVNNAAVSLGAQMPLCLMASSLFYLYPEVDLLDHIVVAVLIFLRTLPTFP